MRHRSEFRTALLFISPILVGTAIFMVYPLIASIYYSFCDYNILSPPAFNGGAHYAELLADEKFHKALWNTLIFTVLAVPVTMATALILAFLLNMKLRGQAVYRTIFFLPSIVPVVASSVLWLWLLNPDYGLINTILRPGISLVNQLFGSSLAAPPWLTDPLYMKPALVLMSAWGVGGSVIIYLAALGDVPRQLYEAAELDGAGAWGKTWHVTLPMISPVIFFTLIMGLIGMFQYFSQPLVIFGGGGRDDSALFYSVYLFQNAFVYLRMGYASAQAWILFLVIVTATILVFRTTRRFVHYEGADR